MRLQRAVASVDRAAVAELFERRLAAPLYGREVLSYDGSPRAETFARALRSTLIALSVRRGETGTA